MKSMLFVLAAAGIVAGTHGTVRAAFDGDLVPSLSGNTLLTGGISDTDGSMASDVSIYQYTLGELSPGYTEDPGFQPQTTSGLPGSSFLGFNVTTGLLYWNGVGTPSFTPVDNAQLELYLGPSNVFINGATGAQDGFVLQQLTADGAGHRHLNAQLLGDPSAAGTYLDSLGNTYDAPADGIYAFGISVTDSLANTIDPATYQSTTKWLVYNQNLSDAILTSGADSLPGSAIPEPASLGILALGATALLTRRKSGR